MRIIELRAENFKRLKAVNITPGEGLYSISGRNAQGKTSVLDAIWAVLGGKEASPGQPVRRGEKSSSATVDLGDLKATRTWTADGKSLLKVENQGGQKYSSPQAVLDALVGSLTFDPLAFGRMDAKAQAITLRNLVGIDTAKLDAEREQRYAERTVANTNAKRWKTEMESIPEVVVEESMDEEVSTADLMKRLQDAMDSNQANSSHRSRLASAESQTLDIAKEIAALESKLIFMKDVYQKKCAELAIMKDVEKSFKDHGVSRIRSEIMDVEAKNRQIRESAEKSRAAATAQAERARRQVELKKAEAESTAKSAAIARIDEAKEVMLAKARFPIKGLSVVGDQVTFNQLPFEQSSAAEQLRISLAIGAALNPKLRVMLVRDGSLLDSDSMTTVARWATENDMQVLIERVGVPEDGVGVVIEDGMVVGAEESL